MIKDFETVKNQLKELSEVINSFKSETVQLKIIEMLFKGVKIQDNEDEEESENEQDEDTEVRTPRKRAKKKAKEKGQEDKEKKSGSTKGRPGPTKTIETLVTEGFFKSKKTIGDIVQHCNDSLALTYKSTDISGKLMKLVRDKKLKREKNASTGQYEYINY